MRLNLPVTNTEYVLKETDTIVPKTDTRGEITYVNRDFVRISGFSEEELLGAPQNIVRHPDMPAEAFADFRRSIKSGKAWTGLVKNRCKNGDYYWVEANAALENGKVVGYTSIRIKPGREQVEAAERAYRAIKSGDRSLEVREGSVVRRSLFQRLAFLDKFSLKAKLMAAALFPALLSVGNAILSWAVAGGGSQYQAAAAESLNGQAVKLSRLITSFRLAAGGKMQSLARNASVKALGLVRPEAEPAMARCAA